VCYFGFRTSFVEPTKIGCVRYKTGIREMKNKLEILVTSTLKRQLRSTYVYVGDNILFKVILKTNNLMICPNQEREKAAVT